MEQTIELNKEINKSIKLQNAYGVMQFVFGSSPKSIE